MPTNTDNNNVRELLDAGRAAAAVHVLTPYQREFAIIPENYKVESLERLRPTPDQIAGAVKVTNVASFVGYITKFVAEGTQLFFNNVPFDPALPSGLSSFMAVLDYHRASEPSWCKHSVSYALRASPELLAWIGNNKKPMAQTEFSEFIENNLLDIVSGDDVVKQIPTEIPGREKIPDPMTMLEAMRSIRAKQSASFGSKVNNVNGSMTFEYSEEVKGSAETSKGQIEIPEVFVIGIPVVEDGRKYPFICRLRYRISEGRLALWYDILRPHKVVEAATTEIREVIEKETQLTALWGTSK